jgi:hypothetical protein
VLSHHHHVAGREKSSDRPDRTAYVTATPFARKVICSPSLNDRSANIVMNRCLTWKRTSAGFRSRGAAAAEVVEDLVAVGRDAQLTQPGEYGRRRRVNADRSIRAGARTGEQRIAGNGIVRSDGVRPVQTRCHQAPARRGCAAAAIRLSIHRTAMRYPPLPMTSAR